MYRSESKVKLLSEDEIYSHGELEGCSSGYDSASDASDDDGQALTCASTITEDACTTNRVMRYNSTDALCGNLQIILAMPELCDVMFLVDDNKIPIYGVRAILSSRSKVIHKIILKAQQEQEMTSQSSQKSKKKALRRHTVIKVRKYRSEDFRKIIHFVHCGKVDISKRTVAGLYCGAVQFGLSDLGKACSDFLSRSSKSSSASELIEHAQSYKEHSAHQRYVDAVNAVYKGQNCHSDKCLETRI